MKNRLMPVTARADATLAENRQTRVTGALVGGLAPARGRQLTSKAPIGPCGPDVLGV